MVTSCPLLGAGYWPMSRTAMLSRRENRRAEETTGGRAGAENRLTNGDILVLSMANCLTANTTIPNWLSHFSSLPLCPTWQHSPPHPHPHPPAAGLNDTCQQRDGVSGVSKSRPACVWLMYTHLQAPQMCTAVFTLMTHTWHKILHDKGKVLQNTCSAYHLVVIYAVLWWHYRDTTFHSETPQWMKIN